MAIIPTPDDSVMAAATYIPAESVDVIQLGGILPAHVIKQVNPLGLTGDQVEALHEVSRRVQTQSPFDINNPNDVMTVALFISTGGSAVVPFDYMLAWIGHPHLSAVHHMLGKSKGRNPELKPASIGFRPSKIARFIDAGSKNRNELGSFFVQELLDWSCAGVRFLASREVPRHMCLTRGGTIVAQTIIPQADSNFYWLVDQFERITGLDMVAITSANWTDERGPHYRLKGALATLGTEVPVIGSHDIDLRVQQVGLVQERIRWALQRMGKDVSGELDFQTLKSAKLTPDQLWPFRFTSTTIVTAYDYEESGGVLTLRANVVRHGSIHVNEVKNLVERINLRAQEKSSGRWKVAIGDEPAPPRLRARQYSGSGD